MRPAALKAIAGLDPAIQHRRAGYCDPLDFLDRRICPGE